MFVYVAIVSSLSTFIPISVFGFFQDSFAGAEQQSGYSVPIGYQKGAALAEKNLVLKVEDSPGTASE